MSEAPKTVLLRGGKRARLVEAPTYNKWNDAEFVTYETDSYRFTLYWPSLTFYHRGPDHCLDVVGELYPLGSEVA